MGKMSGGSKVCNTSARILHPHSQFSHLFVLAQAIMKLCCDQGVNLSRIRYNQKKIRSGQKKNVNFNLNQVTDFFGP